MLNVECALDQPLCSSGLLRHETPAARPHLVHALFVWHVARMVWYLFVLHRMEELTSWKQIATALGVNVRTAQKWERERALPVRRNQGGRVSADSEALAAWQALQSQHTEQYCFRWPVGRGVMAEVRFLGPALCAAHVELLRQYLDLVKAALHD